LEQAAPCGPAVMIESANSSLPCENVSMIRPSVRAVGPRNQSAFGALVEFMVS